MSDIAGNPTPLNVPVAQDASGTLTPKQGSSANVATATPATGVPAATSGAPSGPSSVNTTPPPAVPDLT